MALLNFGFKKIPPPLAVDHWFRRCQGFTFGVPAGWRDFSEQELRDLSLAQGVILSGAVGVSSPESPATYVAIYDPEMRARRKEFVQTIPGFAVHRAQASTRR